MNLVALPDQRRFMCYIRRGADEKEDDRLQSEAIHFDQAILRWWSPASRISLEKRSSVCFLF